MLQLLLVAYDTWTAHARRVWNMHEARGCVKSSLLISCGVGILDLPRIAYKQMDDNRLSC